MSKDSPEKLYWEYQEALKEYQFWVISGNCEPGSLKCREVTERYQGTKANYDLALGEAELEKAEFMAVAAAR